MKLLENRREVAAAVIGALVAGLLSFIVAFYTLNRTFQQAQGRELLLGLRTDIATLANVDREIDDNLKLLLSQSYTLKFEFEEVRIKVPPFGNKASDKEFTEWYEEFIGSIAPKRFVVVALQIPSEKFVTGAWPSTSPTSTDIDFELMQSLQELNRRLVRANAYMEAIATLAPGSQVDEGQRNSLERNVPRFNAAVAEVTQGRLVDLKNKVAAEIKKLQRKRDALE